ncbi:MAG: hypothetical protein JNM24_02560 [Bdellovibrionaceae bacterium]|nr:hypothetical protein [Pseudobdellovibrionaceae bacterium]
MKKTAPENTNQKLKTPMGKEIKNSFWKRLFSIEIDDRKIDEIKRQNELKFMRIHFLG